jgi:hypothetical protein
VVPHSLYFRLHTEEGGDGDSGVGGDGDGDGGGDADGDHSEHEDDGGYGDNEGDGGVKKEVFNGKEEMEEDD